MKTKEKNRFVVWGIIVIAILVVMFVWMLLAKDNGKNDAKVEPENNNIANEQVKNEEDENKITQLDKNDELVKKLYSYIDNKAIGYIYSEVGFENADVSDDLKVRLGFYNLMNKGKIVKNETNNRQYITKADMDASIKEIFRVAKYKPSEKTDLLALSGYSSLNTLHYENGTYYIDTELGGGFPEPAMVQYISKAQKVGKDIVELYTKVYYVSYSPDQSNDWAAVTEVYKDCENYTDDNHKFSNLLMIDSEDIVTIGQEEKSVETIRSKFDEKLNEYKFTYRLTNGGNYYLMSLEKTSK